MPSYKQNEAFAKEIFMEAPLDTAVDWIKANLDPDDVFDVEQMAAHVSDHLGVNDVFKDKEILEYVREEFSPGDVFDADTLNDWAESNGYIADES